MLRYSWTELLGAINLCLSGERGSVYMKDFILPLFPLLLPLCVGGELEALIF